MDAPRLSERFLSWLARAGWVASRFEDDGAFDEEGNCAIWEEDHEGRTLTSYLFHAQENGWFEVADGGSRRPLFTAAGLDIVERYFWGALAAVIRQKAGLDELVRQTRPSAGYRIAGGLVGPAGTVVARGDEQRLIVLSAYLDPALDELEASLLDPEGKPLFTTSRKTA